MRCPYCRHDETRVVDSRDAETGSAVRRRRQCSSCEQRFTTFERAEDVPMIVVKRDGSREPFDRAKVVSGISRACKNRPVGDDDMFRVTDEVEEACREQGAEIPSHEVGRMVLAQLRDLDEVAYVRFASVYRGFEEISEFERVVRELAKETPPKVRSRRRISAAEVRTGPDGSVGGGR